MKILSRFAAAKKSLDYLISCALANTDKYANYKIYGDQWLRE